MVAASPELSLSAKWPRTLSSLVLGHRFTWQRGLQLALGLVWLLDAALQYQPYMFSRAFPHQVLAPTGPGNPAWVASPVHWAAQLTLHHLILLNAVYATVQLAIALGLFLRPTVRLALAGSIVWAILIWWLGEGLGGVLAGPQTPINGAPGAVIIYGLLAVLLWPRDADRGYDNSSIAAGSPTGPLVAKALWLVLWGSFAYEVVQPADRAKQALHQLFAGNAYGEPAWLRSIDHGFASAVTHHGTGISIGLSVILAIVALAVLSSGSLLRVGLVLAIIFALVVWFAGEDLGEIATGTATDPNTGPLLALLALAYWPITMNARPSKEGAADSSV